jgi:multidrug efflux system outer membrane protein
LTEAVQREALVRYERSIQTAFREVSDSLVGFQKTGEQHQQQFLVGALRESNRLSTVRYEGGATATSRFLMPKEACSKANWLKRD